jgi:hypothetical protein
MSRRRSPKEPKMIAPVRGMECELFSERDRRIQSAAAEALSSSSYAAVRKLTCRVSGGELEVFGTVPSFYLKQLAQTALLNLGFSVVLDRIEVEG